MLVKKISDNWQPAENRGLKVGDIIEITDPRELIVNGYVVAVDENGVEMSTYQSYGVLTGTEKSEFEQWLSQKHAEKTETKLKEDQTELKKQVEELKSAEKEKKTVKTVSKKK